MSCQYQRGINKCRRFVFFVVRVRVMVFNAAFNNISAILWRSVLLLEETRVRGENHVLFFSFTKHW